MKRPILRDVRKQEYSVRRYLIRRLSNSEISDMSILKDKKIRRNISFTFISSLSDIILQAPVTGFDTDVCIQCIYQ